MFLVAHLLASKTWLESTNIVSLFHSDLDSGSDEDKDNDVEIVDVKKTWMHPPK